MFRIPPGSRIPELFESLKTEIEALAHEANIQKMQKEDLERKVNSQYNEVTSIQNAVYELDRAHAAIKKQYEEENIRLKRQLEQFQTSNPGFHLNGNDIERNSTIEKGLSGLSNGPIGFGSSIENKRLFPVNGNSPSIALKRPRLDNTPNNSTPNNDANFYPGQSLPPLSSDPKTSTNSSSSMPSLPAPKIENFNSFQFLKGHQELSRSRESAFEASGESDWIVGYAPNVPQTLGVDLAHTHDHSSVVCCVKFSQDGKYLATGCNKSAQILDVVTGEQIHNFRDEGAKDEDLYIRSVCFSPDGKFLATGAEDKTVKVWDIERKSVNHTFSGHELDIYSLDFSPNGNIIVSGSGDKKAKVWDLETRTSLLTLGNEESGPKDGVTSVAISPDGRFVAAGSLDRVVRIWEVMTGILVEKYEGHTDSVYSVAFSPDGKSLASGSLDKTLKLWDLASNRNRARLTFTGHKDFVLSVAFSPDGNWLVSGSKDRSVQFWDPKTSIAHLMLQGHKNSVISVAMNPMSGTFATGSGDFRARVWKFKPVSS